MISFNMPLLMVAAFLLLTLAVGIYFSRKKTTFREYAIGNKKFATATLVATALATAYSGGGLVRNVEQVHHLGLYWIILSLLGDLGLWIVGWLALRMGSFMHNLSMAETIGSVYGKVPRIITALCSIGSSITMVAMQVHVMSLAISMCVSSINPGIITIFSTLILIFYSTFGGIRAITLTDVLQFITFSIILPFLAWFIFVKVDKPTSEIISFLQNQEKFQFSSLFHWDTNLVAMVALILSFIVSYIDSTIIQRIYMSSSPIQARNIFLYAGFVGIIINIFICLIGLFVFVGAPLLQETEIWDYVMASVPPIFKGFISISLLAMAMSSADSDLNSGAVVVSHDMLESIRSPKKGPYLYQLRLARLVSIFIGLSAMTLTFHYRNLLDLLKLNLDLYVPIAVAPFILAIFGFRGTSRTALIGMATGVLSILAWKKWVEPPTGIDGSFICMLANGLAMMAAHYLLPQPKGTGWVGPDDEFKQMQQAKARKRARRKEAIKNAFKKVTFAQFRPNDIMLALVGIYIIITSILSLWMITPIYWSICQLLVGTFFACYALFACYKIFFTRVVPDWIIGLCWFIGLIWCLPINVLWHWWHLQDPIFMVSLSLVHLSLALLVLPPYLGIKLVAATLLVAIYPISIGLTSSVLCSLFPLLVGSLMIFLFISLLKLQLGDYISQNLYLKNQKKFREAYKLKKAVYNSTVVPPTAPAGSNGMGTIVEKIVRTIEESISLFDRDTPLYKQDFQSIINKLYDWVAYFKKKGKAKDHMLLEATKITLDQLIHKLDFALTQEVAHPPRLFIESIDAPNGAVPSYIICDVNQVVYLLVKSVLTVMDLDSMEPQFVRLQFYATHLKFAKSAALEEHNYPPAMLFRSMGLVLSNATTSSDKLPIVESYYEEIMDDRGSQGDKIAPPSIDLRKETISSIIRAHYGYLSYPTDAKQKMMLLVLPTDVTAIRNEMVIKLPIDCLMSETAITPKEQADSLMVLMDFHDFICKLSHEVDPIDLSIISGILQLLRERFGFKRHGSGQLFYVRAVGIAQLVTEWIFHSPKPIYASLLYELVRYTCLPLSYIKAHYNLGVYVFVQNVLGVDKRQAMESSLLYVHNRFDKAVAQEQVQLSVLYIKLAERLYDLRHADGYAMVEEVQYMAKETLTIDIKLAHHYLDPEIAAALETAAKQALKICKDKAH